MISCQGFPFQLYGNLVHCSKCISDVFANNKDMLRMIA